jgi:hypothetical protein
MGSSARPFSLDFVEIFRAFNNTTQQLPLPPPIIDLPPPFSASDGGDTRGA